MAAVPHPTAAEREASGRAARTRAPRSGQSALDLPADRDPIAVLAAQDATRVPDLVPIRYGRMLAGPLTFLRGAAAVMARDLAGATSSGLRVQLCGDAHLLNFGGFATPERNLVFDVNDFDETLAGPFEWDVKRLAASLEVAGRVRGFGDADRAAAVLGAVGAYRAAMRRFAGLGDLEVWYARLDADAVVGELRAGHDRKLAKELARELAQRCPPESTHPDSRTRVTPRMLVSTLDDICGRALKFRTEHKLGIYKKARLGNTFRWELTDLGYDKRFAEDATQRLIVRIARKG